MIRIGIDIGGTFTDFAIWDGNPDGYTSVGAFKVPSTPPAFAEGVKAGLRQLLASGTIRRDDSALIVHGTTVSTNAVIERSGPPLALLVTAVSATFCPSPGCASTGRSICSTHVRRH